METKIFIGIGVLALGILIGSIIWWNMKYKTEYSRSLETKAQIIDKQYIPARTEMYYSFTAKAYRTRYISAKHKVTVFIPELNLSTTRNNSSLYNNVQVEDNVKVIYRQKFTVERKNPRKREFVGNIIDNLITEQGLKFTI